jgi:hypothetical protein
MARILQTGFEFPGSGTAIASGTYVGLQSISAGNVPSLGIPVSSSSNQLFKVPAGYSGSYTAHKSVTGLGGSSYLIASGSSTTTTVGSSTVSIREGYFGFGYRQVNSAGVGIKLEAKDSSSLTLFGLYISGGNFQIVNAGFAASVASTAVSFDTSIWSWVTCDFKIHPTDGYVKVYVNSISGNSVPLVQASIAWGATNGIKNVSNFAFTAQNATSGVYLLDDFVVNSKSISFISSSGSIVSGNTITGATSGATAAVTAVENYDSTYGVANGGRLTIHSKTGTFVDGETISNGSGWSAEIQLAGGGEAGLDLNSAKPGETYLLGLSLSADRTVEMTGSDGNQTDNYALLNEQIADDTTYVEALGVSTAMDLYELEDITQNATVISAISVNTRLKKSGEINSAIPAINLNGTTQYSPSVLDISTNLSYRKKHSIIEINQATNDPFSKQEVNDSAIGIRFK